jgi:hypothetical protein
MKNLVLCAVAAAALGGCSAAAGEKTYAMPVEDVRRILLSTDFERGILPGSSSLKPRVWVNMGGEIEWTVLDEAKKHGWWCALAIEPASEDGKTSRVVNQCKGITASKDNKNLDELVDAALTDRAPRFE